MRMPHCPGVIIEKTISSSNFLPPSLKISCPQMYAFVLEFKILFYTSVLTPVSQYLDYCSFILSFEIGKCESYNFVLFQIVLAILVSCISIRILDQLMNLGGESHGEEGA